MMGWEDRTYHRDTSDHDMYSRVRGWSVVYWLTAICIVVFFIDGFTARSLGRPYWAGGLLSVWGNFNAQDAIFGVQIWRILSFQFLHHGLLHIIFNLLMLFFLGRFVESFLGSSRFLAFYLLCGVGGAMLYLILWGLGAATGNPNIPFLLTHGPDTPLVGASAGVFGLLMGAAIVAPDQRVCLWIPPITVSLRVIAWVLFGIALFMVMVEGQNAGGEAAHLGGAVAGYVMIKQLWLLNWVERIRLPRRSPAASWEKKMRKQRDAEAKEQAEVDRILDKVRDHGLHSLSKTEKRILQRATDRQRRAG